MTEYHVRIDGTRTQLSTTIRYLQKNSQEFGYAQENLEGKNPHVHCYVVTNVKNTTLRRKIREALDADGRPPGNKSYSISQKRKTTESLIHYCMKGGRFHRGTIPVEKIEAAKLYEPPDDKKQTCLLDYADQYYEKYLRKKSSRFPRIIFELQQAVSQEIIRRGTMLRQFIVRSTVDTIMYRRNSDFRQWYDMESLPFSIRSVIRDNTSLVQDNGLLDFINEISKIDLKTRKIIDNDESLWETYQENLSIQATQTPCQESQDTFQEN